MRILRKMDHRFLSSMFQNPHAPRSLVLFCKVVDNYGDIGICWRLARQLTHEHGVAVTLWVDDLHSFQRLCPEIRTESEEQNVAGIAVHHWRDQDGVFAPQDIADIVIEFFACDIPPGYIEAMAQCEPRPVWFNLEGLTAEEWVEGCHTLPSSHPQLPLTKHFFFPGFTPRTGGLLHESGLEHERAAFQSDTAARQRFLDGLGLTTEERAAQKISLFCYPHAPVADLLHVWQAGDMPVCCLVPEGVAKKAISAFLEIPATAGAVRTRGALTVRVLPFIPQPDYDRLLWSCDLNFVRGEDSWVRAQWAARPFVWHIYPQDENLHHKKLKAFLQRYAENIESLTSLSLCWNGAAQAADGWMALWRQFNADGEKIMQRASAWQQQMLENGDLTSNLLKFADALVAERDKNQV